MKLKGKASIIVGATSGIGEATAYAYAREGAKVTIAGRSENAGKEIAERICSEGGEAKFVRTDLTHLPDIEALFKKHMSHYGQLDILINNAAYEGVGTLVADTTEEIFDNVLDTNFKGIFFSCKYAAPIMSKAKAGTIINTTAASAREGLAWPNLGAYIGSKGAVIAFTRALAVELAAYGIRVNSLNPGVIYTPKIEEFGALQEDPEAFKASIARASLLNRMGTVDEIAKAAVFLASDDAAFMTGTDMLVDGGLVLGGGAAAVSDVIG